MKKVIVIGCPGSGKSVFSRALSVLTGLPVYPLDMLRWREDKTIVPDEELIQKILEIGATDEWIMDGNYGATMELRMSLCDTVFFLDYPVDVCLEGVMARRGKARSDLPWIEPTDEIDEEFLDFIQNYNTVNRPVVLERLTKYSDKNTVIFKSRKDADTFLDSLKR